MDSKGVQWGTKEEVFPLNERSREEQSPEQWWASCLRSLRSLLAEARSSIDLKEILSLSVTSTSGTVIPLDQANQPLHPAIMYSDGRSAVEAAGCREAAEAAGVPGYTAFNASSGLAKMVWFVRRFPDRAQRLARFIHAADYITGRLSNCYHVTDYTNALKSGYDVHHLLWPEYIWTKLPLQKEWFQQVVPSGKPVGKIIPALAADLGLSPETLVVAGMTDGCASQIASGAVSPGDWNTTIGTTLVIKGVTEKFMNDPEGRLYSHRHPEGFWMPGGASNTGADWITRLFKDDLAQLNREAALETPTGRIAFPLMQKGERFPFAAPQAEGFLPEGLSPAGLFAACLEGVAYLECYAYEMIEQLSGEKVEAVFTAGGGSNSDTWLRIRASVLNRPIYKMTNTTGAAGAAILAASQTHFGSLTEAGKALTQTEKSVQPENELVLKFAPLYQQFKNSLTEKGYLNHRPYA